MESLLNKKQFFLTIIFIMAVGVNAFAEIKCNDERKTWIKQLKIDLKQDFINPVYSENECVAEIIEHNGIPIDQHMYRLAGEKRDDFKDLEARKTRDLLNELFVDIDVSENINWVPKDFEKKLRSTTD